MARIKGLLEGFSGKVVDANWHGQDIIRSTPGAVSVVLPEAATPAGKVQTGDRFLQPLKNIQTNYFSPGRA